MRQRKKARRFGGSTEGVTIARKETVAPRRRWRPDWPVVVALVALLAILCSLFLALGVSWVVLAKVVVLVAVLAAYVTVIALLDGDSRSAVANRPLVRTLACGVLGVAMAFVLMALSSHGEESWLLAGAMFGAALGWLGTGWARFL